MVEVVKVCSLESGCCCVFSTERFPLTGCPKKECMSRERVVWCAFPSVEKDLTSGGWGAYTGAQCVVLSVEGAPCVGQAGLSVLEFLATGDW